MTVRELIHLLGTLDPNALVVLSSDAEGNEFLPLSGDYSIGQYDGKAQDFCDDSDIKGESAVALWPIHRLSNL